ncbi:MULTISPECIES: ribosomal protein S18-alanine N-acetyltransferase [Alteromonas]|uniref:ribosomal protein S18-alanine N-acetyltransferase n=1 Tax=Alteromonas TaxID=226 RepID=UPI0013580F0B|nr:MULTISPECIES: ribosomal protein S18-alanine N-acetyltransferase [Alteromonas]
MHIQLISDTSSAGALAQAYGIHEASQFKPWSFETFVDCTTTPYFGVLAIKDDQVVGYALVLEVLDEATLMDIAVNKCCRQEGIGRALVEYVKQHAQHNGMTSMWLEVRASNVGAINLYENTGFEHIEVRKGYYQTATSKEDAKIMKASF